MHYWALFVLVFFTNFLHSQANNAEEIKNSPLIEISKSADSSLSASETGNIALNPENKKNSSTEKQEVPQFSKHMLFIEFVLPYWQDRSYSVGYNLANGLLDAIFKPIIFYGYNFYGQFSLLAGTNRISSAITGFTHRYNKNGQGFEDYFSVDFISLGYMHPSYPIMFSAGFAYFNKAPHKFEFDTTNFAPSFSVGYLLSERTFIAFVYTLPVMAIQNRIGSFLLAFGLKIF